MTLAGNPYPMAKAPWGGSYGGEHPMFYAEDPPEWDESHSAPEPTDQWSDEDTLVKIVTDGYGNVIAIDPTGRELTRFCFTPNSGPNPLELHHFLQRLHTYFVHDGA